MITLALYVVVVLAFLVIAACIVVWIIQREPAGHGQHATRRTLTVEYEDLECFQPDPALAVATLHNPLVLMDQLAAAGETRRAENLRLMHAPGTPSYYPYAAEHVHRDWTPRAIDPRRDGLAPWIEIALANAQPDETVIDHRLTGDSRDAWETGTAEDVFEGHGDAEGWVRALIAGEVTVPA